MPSDEKSTGEYVYEAIKGREKKKAEPNSPASSFGLNHFFAAHGLGLN